MHSELAKQYAWYAVSAWARRPAEGCTITRMTASATPAFLRLASSVDEVSNSQVDDFILATVTSDERRAWTMVRTSLCEHT
jgi:hypothetical protein